LKDGAKKRNRSIDNLKIFFMKGKYITTQLLITVLAGETTNGKKMAA
jgi:hypothetical protein